MAVSIARGELDCQTCNEEMRKERGCEQDSGIPDRWQIGEESYQRCPVKLVTRQSHEYIHAYSLFCKGFLPNGKGWGNETYKFLQAMQIVEKHSQKEVKNAR